MQEQKILEAILIYKLRNKVSDERIADDMGMTRRNLVYIRKRVADGVGLTQKQLSKLKAYCEQKKIAIS